jgi:hypothetical protein
MATAALAESFQVGTWLSLVEHSLGVRGVGSSNLPVPTNSHFSSPQFPFTAIVVEHPTFASSEVGRAHNLHSSDLRSAEAADAIVATAIIEERATQALAAL